MTYSIKATKPSITAHFAATKATLESKKQRLTELGYTIAGVKSLKEVKI